MFRNAAEIKKFAIISPAPIQGSGGVARIFTFATALAKANYECHVYVFDAGDRSPEAIKKEAKDFYGASGFEVFCGTQIQQHYNFMMATRWDTAKLVHSADVDHRLYLVQDFEATFNPVGDGTILAENTYLYSLQPITYGRWLANKLNRDYGNVPYHLDFASNLKQFKLQTPYAQRKEDPLSICFIYQSDKPRRCPHLGIEALGIVSHFCPEVKIHLIGSKERPHLWFDFVNHGILDLKGLNDLYNRCHIGLCLSSSNPSCNPFDMMAAGLPSVELYRENNLFDLPDEGVLLAHQTPESLAEAIIHLIKNRELRQSMSEFGSGFMAERSAANEAEEFLSFVKEFDDPEAQKKREYIRQNRIYNKPAIVSKSYKSEQIVANIRAQVPSNPETSNNQTSTEDLVLPLSYTTDEPAPVRPESEKPEIVTLDVWDTLIRRKCHPDAVKLHVGRHFLLSYHDRIREEYRSDHALLSVRQGAEGTIGQENKLAGYDDEYCFLDVHKMWLKQVLIDEADIDEIANNLCEIELAKEREVIFKDPKIEGVLKDINASEHVFVSDFYMGKKELQSLIDHVGLGQIVKRGYSSCDVLLNKRSGRLFQHVLEEEQWQAKRILHIGDNHHSDVDMAKSHGLEATHYVPEPEHEDRLKREAEFTSPQTKIANFLAEISDSSSFSKYSDKDKNNLYTFGQKNSSLVFGFILQIMEESIKAGHRKVFFFTREGEFFKEVYDTVAQFKPFGVEPPESEILEVSRIATFGPSILEINFESLMRMWNLYSSQSMGAMLSSIDINPDSFSEILSKYGLSLEEIIQYPWLDTRVQELMNDQNFTSTVNLLLAEKRNLLLSYLNSKGFPIEGKTAIVDIGWRGTIQDNLAILLPNVKIDGFYIGLDQLINTQPENVRKLAFAANKNIESDQDVGVFDKVSPIEMLFNSTNGSVTGYSKDDGTIRANRLSEPSEDSVHDLYISIIQEGFVDAAAKLSQFAKDQTLSSDDFHILGKNNWISLAEDPPKYIAHAYFQLKHNESFGVGSFADKSKGLGLSTWFKAVVAKSGFNNLESELRKTGWQEGYLRQSKMNWVWKVAKNLNDIRNH